MLSRFWRSWRKASSAEPKQRAALALQGECIAFVANVDAPLQLTAGDVFRPDLASMRLRIAVPAARLARHSAVWLVPIDSVGDDPELKIFGRPRGVVVGKLPVGFFTRSPESARRLMEWIEHRARSQRVFVDFSDDLKAAATILHEPMLSEFQERCLRACHATVPCYALRERLLADARHDVSVIEDPIESERAGTPRLHVNGTLRLAWFGVFVPEQRSAIEQAFGDIAARLASRPIELAFIAQASQAAAIIQMARTLCARSPNLTLRHVPWSIDAVQRELEGTDLVVLPQDARSAWGRVKSHNRLVETIRAGRFAIASAIPSYLELSSYAWVGNDLASGVEWALANEGEASRRITAGQAYIAERFSPERIAAEWARLLDVQMEDTRR